MNLACCVQKLGGLIPLNVHTTPSLLIFIVIAVRILMMLFHRNKGSNPKVCIKP